MRPNSICLRTLLVVAALTSATVAAAEGGDEKDLAAAAQNPLATMISLPFQNNLTYGGEGVRNSNTLNIQPVYPVGLSDDWDLITRTILPVASWPIGQERVSGLSDASFTGWFSPDTPGKMTWGVGPVISIPTSTKSQLGSGQWGGGASAIGVFIGGPWVAGALVNNVWGFSDTDRLNSFLLQYFINYNLDHGWYLVSAPIITSNWNLEEDNRWVVPFGAGVGRIFRVGKLPVNFNAQYYRNVDKPDGYGESTFRVQLQFMFPKQRPPR